MWWLGYTCRRDTQHSACPARAGGSGAEDRVVKRDGSGNFAAVAISAASVNADTLVGDGSNVTNFNGTNSVGGTVGNVQLAANCGGRRRKG